MQAFAVAQGANIAAKMPYLFDADLQLKSIFKGEIILLCLKKVRCNYGCHCSFDWSLNGGSYDLSDFGTLYCVNDITFLSLHWTSRAELFGEVGFLNLFQGFSGREYKSRIGSWSWANVSWSESVLHANSPRLAWYRAFILGNAALERERIGP